MCWAAIVDGVECRTRDQLEAAMGMQAFPTHNGPRLDRDHCLCSIDVAGSLVAAGFWVASAAAVDAENDPGDWIARRVTASPDDEAH